MNIFVLDCQPIAAAQMQCDKHVVKMCAESAQMLASALRRHGIDEALLPLTKAGTPYKSTHPHHPCTRWVGDTGTNFDWLCVHGLALCDEYYFRYRKIHACQKPIDEMRRANLSHKIVPAGDQTPFPQALPDAFKCDNVVEAYRSYYKTKHFAMWEMGRPAPEWWEQGETSLTTQ